MGGTADLLAYFKRQQGAAADQSLAQIRSRISPYVDLMSCLEGPEGGGELLVTVEQIREMFARNRLRLTPSASRFLCVLANLRDNGGVRACVQLVEYITAVADARKWTAIDISHLKAAMRYVLPPDRATAKLQSIQELAEQLGLKIAVG